MFSPPPVNKMIGGLQHQTVIPHIIASYAPSNMGCCMTEYTVKLRYNQSVTLMAQDFNHAVSEAVDEWGWEMIIGIFPTNDLHANDPLSCHKKGGAAVWITP